MPQGLTYPHKPRTWGLRLSLSDVTVLFLGLGLGVVGLALYRHVWLAETLWAMTFLSNVFIFWYQFKLTLVLALWLQLSTTIVIILQAIREPNYHGIFARQLNPQLEDYLAGKD